MPKFNDHLFEQHKNPTGRYGFSASRIDDLLATEFTLATIVLDESGSTASFKMQMEECIQAVVEECRKSSWVNNILFRLVAFGTKLREVHGFKPLEQCEASDYDGFFHSGGCTALYDSTENGIRSSLTYAGQLSRNDFLVNGIVFVLTDGDDNSSSCGIPEVKAAIQNCITTETMESLISVLVGVNVQCSCIAQYLDTFYKQAEFTQYVRLDDADAKTLAKLADLVSKSILSQSQALGMGTAMAERLWS